MCIILGVKCNCFTPLIFIMQKDLEFIELFEIYKGLLTDKQRELFTWHFLYDLSLAEIAQEEGGSRQNVYDAIKKVKAKLIEYEKVLGLREKFTQIQDVANQSEDKEVYKKIIDIIGR